MEKLSQLAYHPLKMQSCYEKMEPLRLDGLQQRFDVSSTSVFKQRAQIHMREVGPSTHGHPLSTGPLSWGEALPSTTVGPGPTSSGATQQPHSAPGVLTPALASWVLPICWHTCSSG